MVDYPFVTSYAVGNASVGASGLTVTGQGTFWQDNTNPELSPIRAGDLFGTHKGFAIRILEVVSATELTLAHPWPGADQDLAEYEIQLTPRIVGAQQATRLLQKQLASGNISAFAALEGQSNLLPMFSGAGTMTLVTKQSLVSGADYNVQVNDIAARATYDGSAANFRVLVADIGDGRSAIYSKNSSSLGDWSAPAIITGRDGEDGDPGAPGSPGPFTTINAGNVTTLAPGSQATATFVPVSTGVVRLDLGLPAGQDGTGAGTVTSVAVSVPTGLQVGGSPITSNGTIAITYQSGYQGFTTAQANIIANLGNSASRNVGTTAGTVAAGDDARFSQGGSSQNEAILALEIADLKGSRLGMKGGVADAFDDETGVDTAASVNATYDATNDWYTRTPGGYTADLTTTGQAISAGDYSGNAASNAFDNNTATSNYWGSSQTGSAINGVAYIGQNFGAGNAKKIRRLTLLQNVAAQNSVSSVQVIYSDNGTSWTSAGTFAVAQNATPYTLDIPDVGSHQYWAIRANAGLSTGAATWAVNEVQMMEAVGGGEMTLRSVAYAAASVPTTGRVAIQLVETDAITINTDIIVRISRDGGTTWATASLSLSQSLIGPKIYEATGISLSSLGSGTLMKWEVATANNKNVAISGVVLQWS